MKPSGQGAYAVDNLYRHQKRLLDGKQPHSIRGA